jgi:hypothetical protein
MNDLNNIQSTDGYRIIDPKEITKEFLMKMFYDEEEPVKNTVDLATHEIRLFDRFVGGLHLLHTNSKPLQYSIYDLNGTQVAFLRERKDKIECDVPDYGGESVYEADGVLYGDDDDHLNKLVRILRLQAKGIEVSQYEESEQYLPYEHYLH